MRQALAAAAFLLLGGCDLTFPLTKGLWTSDPQVVALDRYHARPTVEGIGVRREEGADGATRLFLCTRLDRERSTDAMQPLIGEPCWFTLGWPEDPAKARAMADLFASQPIGAIDRCSIEASWTLTAQGERNWEGWLEVRGALAPELRGTLDEAAARALLGSAALALPEPPPPGLARCMATAAAIDWRILLPEETDGSGCVIGCLPRGSREAASLDDASTIDLLVRTGRSGPHRYLRVPAAAMPVLALAWRDPMTLRDRFVLQTWCQVRLAEPPVPLPALQTPPPATTFLLSSGEEMWTDKKGWQQVLATPFLVLADLAVWFLRHGPIQILPEPKQSPPVRQGG